MLPSHRNFFSYICNSCVIHITYFDDILLILLHHELVDIYLVSWINGKHGWLCIYYFTTFKTSGLLLRYWKMLTYDWLCIYIHLRLIIVNWHLFVSWYNNYVWMDMCSYFWSHKKLMDNYLAPWIMLWLNNLISTLE